MLTLCLCILCGQVFCNDIMIFCIQTFCDIKDLSYGKENVPISCVNGIDRQYPDYVDYSNVRTPAKGVKLNLDPEFLVGCDCTDGCRVSCVPLIVVYMYIIQADKTFNVYVLKRYTK